MKAIFTPNYVFWAGTKMTKVSSAVHRRFTCFCFNAGAETIPRNQK
jgi:hypothetical protein